MRYAKLYRKFFLATAVPFAAAMGILLSLVTFPTGLILGLLAGTVFGGAASLALGSFHIWAVKRLVSPASEESFKVHQTRAIELRVPYEEAFDRCILSLSLIKATKSRCQDRSQGILEARTGISWKSLGERISFKILAMEADRTKIEVSSRPIIRTTVGDYGKNLQNVQTLVRFLEATGPTCENPYPHPTPSKVGVR